MLLNYTADLTFGRKNTAQALKTPLTRALGMSPARIQPCVGYLAGAAKDSDPYSLIGIGQQAAGAGHLRQQLQHRPRARPLARGAEQLQAGRR